MKKLKNCQKPCRVWLKLVKPAPHLPAFAPLAQRISDTAPFVGPEALERIRAKPFLARLGANENGFGPSPQVLKVLTAEASLAWMYGDPECYSLRLALALHLGTRAEHIVAGEGIDGLLGVLTRLFVGQGQGVVTSAGAYPTFEFHVLAAGGILHKVPFLNDHEDPSALLALAHQVRPKLLYLSNPNNPMGSVHHGARIEKMIEDLPQGTLLVLDEAYCEMADKETIPQIDPMNQRVIRLRTFSKAYGLAGLRVGYAIGHPQVIKGFERLRNHFGLGRLAQAGALAALQDQTYLHATLKNIAQARQTITQIAHDNGLVALASATNFVTIDCGQDGAFAARVMSLLAQAGLFVRKPSIAPMDRCIRVSVGPKADCDLLRAALPGALAQARDGS